MDKFTVDLEKVLDEFEYSEGREEAVVPPAIRNHSYPRNSPKPVRPPAAAYRRPTFEPISLADADFSADPSSVSGQIINVAKHKSFTEQKFTCLDENNVYPLSHPSLPTFDELNSLNKTDSSSDDSDRAQEHHEPPKPSDETPDLLDSNSLKSTQNGVDQESVLDKAQLPDITSVHSYSEPEEDIKTVEELDLIKRHSLLDSPDSDSSDDLPPIVGIDTVIKANLPDLQVAPLTFDSVEIPDSDLASYLDSLEQESSGIDAISENITDCVVNHIEPIPSVEQISHSFVKESVLESKPEVQKDSTSTLSTSEPDLNVSLLVSPLNETPVEQGSTPASSYFDSQVEPQETIESFDIESGSAVTFNSVVDNYNEEGPVSLSSDLDERETSGLSSHNELDTKQKYSICPDISDEYDEPEEPINVPDLSTSERNFTVSDIDNGNVTDDVKLILSERIENEVTTQNESNEEETITQVLNLNSIQESVGETCKPEIKDVVCDSACESGLSKNLSESDRQINRIIIRVPSESSDTSSLTEIASTSVITQKTVVESPDQIEVNNTLNESINQTVHANSVNESISNCVVNESLNYSAENPPFNTLTCLPSESTTQVFVVDGISQVPEQSIECLDNTLNSNSDELVQNLQNAETEREEIDNRDNEEKAELGLDSENNDASANSDYFYPGDSSNSTENNTDLDMKPSRPSTLPLPHSHIVTDSEESPTPSNSSSPSVGGVMSPEERSLGKRPPYWVPDTESDSCMLCNAKFTVIKRRHHCRACGLVLCSKCCNLKAPLEYMGFAEARVCQPCFNIIYRVGLDEGRYNRGRQPNPNNPMEYCSTVPPLQQVSTSASVPPAVFVPTSVLKREGRARSDTPKQVMFSDGIRPGGDLTELDGSAEGPRLLPIRARSSFNRKLHPVYRSNNNASSEQIEKRPLDPATQSFIPASGNLPPMVTVAHGSMTFLPDQLTSVGAEPVKFAINYNLFINVKRVKLNCCVNREVWSVCSEGLCLVGQDEVAFILEALPEETLPHVDIFHLVNYLWKQAALGSTASEMCFTAWFSNTLLGSNDHGGFLYIRPSLQCTTNLLLPSQPYLIALLVHRWETGWARLFPLRLVLRLGAEYRYYPCPLVSVRNRQPLYTDIGHTIMKILADFRKFSYSLATVRGMVIHLEDKQTTILFPRNRYDQVTRALNNSNESVLAFGANLSLAADSHLVCIQGAKDENTYHTEAINIHNKPRKVTGASFVVFNGALKGSGDTGRSSILEDGLMVHLTPDRMAALRSALRSMHDFSLPCGPEQDETVLIHWTNDDTNFNVGVQSCIDGQPLDGVPSIRVHNGTDYTAHSRLIRWTEVFILQCEDGVGEPVDVSRVSESISRATCSALVPLLDALATADLNPLAIRATIHQENVGYDAGSRGEKLPTQYMKRLDDELVPVLHQAAMSQPSETPVVLELIFRIMLTP